VIRVEESGRCDGVYTVMDAGQGAPYHVDLFVESCAAAAIHRRRSVSSSTPGSSVAPPLCSRRLSGMRTSSAAPKPSGDVRRHPARRLTASGVPWKRVAGAVERAIPGARFFACPFVRRGVQARDPLPVNGL
jgi:hypothetical protein